MGDDKYYFEKRFFSRGLFEHRFDIEILNRILEYKKSGKILDLGFGSGALSIELARKGFSVTAVDISKSAVFNLRRIAEEEKLNIRVIEEDIEEYDIKENYDLVFFTGVSHFLKKPKELIKIIQECTKDAGVNVIDVLLDSNFKEDEIKEIYKNWKIKDFESYLESFGRMNYLLAIKN